MRAAAGVLGVLLCAWPRSAAAYRPFDGTDADVAELHEFEIELGPVGYYVRGGSRYLVTGGVLNFGLIPRVELVVQGFDFVPLDAQSGLNKFTDTGVFAKTVWREGCLQGKAGPSFATEVGPLLPTIHDAKGFGAYAGGILSTCLGDALIIHWNAEAQILRQTYDLDVFGGAILEPPPSKYAVRPVSELFVEHDFTGGRTYSALLGGIWQVSGKLAIDAAIRGALSAGQRVSEVRAGFSWTIP